MNRLLTLAAILVLQLIAPANAAPFDYLIVMPDEATARADPVVSQFYVAGSDDSGNPTGNWRQDICFQPIQRWDSAADTTDADGNAVHAFLPGWAMICVIPARQPALEAEASTYLIYDEAQPGPAGLVYSWEAPADLATKWFQPTPAGSNYPFGSP